MDERISKVLKALENNNMDAFYAETAAEAKAKALSLIKEGMTVAYGGSVTLKETGILDAVSCGNYDFLDRSKAKTPEELKNIYRGCFSADVYLSSANAITENGELYNVDGTGNRIAAIAYGPDSVIIVAGKNKIVSDLDEAVIKVKSSAAPKNCVRLSKGTYCRFKGNCAALDTGCDHSISDITEGCRSKDRICRDYLITGIQAVKGRIKVIIVNEDLGY